jgi:hypothetical protein
MVIRMQSFTMLSLILALVSLAAGMRHENKHDGGDDDFKVWNLVEVILKAQLKMQFAFLNRNSNTIRKRTDCIWP